MPELLEYLYEIGPVIPSGMGLLPVTWTDIAAWQAVTGVMLDPYESAAVRELSMSYIDQHERSRSPSCPAPWVDPEHVDREAVAARILSQFRAFSRRRRRGKHRDDRGTG